MKYGLKIDSLRCPAEPILIARKGTKPVRRKTAVARRVVTMADFVDQVVLKEQTDLLKDETLIEDMRDVLERAEVRHSWQGVQIPT
jgi:hypothetical protein